MYKIATITPKIMRREMFNCVQIELKVEQENINLYKMLFL